MDVADVSRKTFDLLQRNSRSFFGWKMNCISEQCANNATMCHNLDGQKFQQLMDFKKNKNKKECYINPVSTAVTFILFLFLKKCESTKNAKCI